MDSSLNNKIIVKSLGDNALVLQGNTHPYRDTIKKMGGQWNSNLRMGDVATKGWVFPRIKLEAINTFIKQVSDGKVKPLESSPPQVRNVEQSREYLLLETRVLSLEKEMELMRKTISTFQSRLSGSSPSPSSSSSTIQEPSESEPSESESPVVCCSIGDKNTEEETPRPIKRLLHRK